MPLDFPPDTTLSGEEFFRTEGAYTSLGAPIPGGQVGRWILREGPHIDSDRRNVRRAVLAPCRRRLAVVPRDPPHGDIAPADPGPRRALAAPAEGRRGIPDPARQRSDRRVFAQPDPRHDRARNAVSPPPHRGHPGISVAIQAQGFRRHRLFRAGAQSHLPALSGGDLGHRPAERLQRRRYCRARRNQSGARRDRRASRHPADHREPARHLSRAAGRAAGARGADPAGPRGAAAGRDHDGRHARFHGLVRPAAGRRR